MTATWRAWLAAAAWGWAMRSSRWATYSTKPPTNSLILLLDSSSTRLATPSMKSRSWLTKRRAPGKEAS